MSGVASDRRLGILDGLIYSDVFDCALTFDELRRYAREPVTGEALRRLLESDPAVSQLILRRGGLHCLYDRPELLERRPPRIDHGRTLQRRARRVSKVIRMLPFVRGLMLTGSAAAADAGADADVDVLVVVARDRLGTAFFVLGSASRLLGRRFFCPNFYVCEGCLDLPTENLYVAHEVVQARGLVGDARLLLEANPWIARVFPNASVPEPVAELASGGWLQQGLEAALGGSLGERLERWALGVAASRLRAHYRDLGGPVPADVKADLESGRALRFHGGDVDRLALQRYASRRGEVAGLFATEGAAGATR